MIPKIIHYCWFGPKKMPELAIKCIESWKRNCPDYEIIKWNEENFDIGVCNYVREAYESGKYAFVSDFLRLYVLVNYGGIYMDTDVEVIKPIDQFLQEKAFSGFESKTDIPTGIIGAEKDFPLFVELLNEYYLKHFVKENGQLDLIPNVVAITNLCEKYGLVRNNTKQNIYGFTLYPKNFFCPKDWSTNDIDITENTYTIHHFSGSWVKRVSEQLLESKIEEIKNVSKLYMYGAGEYACKCIEILNKKDVEIHGVIVTSMNDKCTFFGHKIIEVGRFTDKDALILIAVSENHYREIREILEKKNIKNYIYVCD